MPRPAAILAVPLRGRRQCEDEKVSVVSNLALGTASRLGRRCVEGLPRALSQCWVIDRVVNLVGILAQPAVYLFQRPRGAVPGIYAFSDLAGSTPRSEEHTSELQS